ncbi:MAG TPA: OmpA family protein [Bryobacteraceae bacterium]|nr:OmpA family protein [Bryobacteraceae bacterium]
MGKLFVALLGMVAFAAAQAQVETPQTGTPVYKVTAVSRTIKAVNYHHRTGTTSIDFRGTSLMPEAKGRARVESRMGSTKVETDVDHLLPPGTYGPEFLTYVLWAVTPEGRAQNLGELTPDGDHAKLLSTTELQAFGLIVTAEPYFAVTQPSDVVVMENFVSGDTTGTIQPIEAKYELLPRGAYTMNRTDLQPVQINPKGPLQVAEAENAVRIARLAGAEAYAADTLQKAQVDLQNAQGLVNRGNTRKQAETAARGATQAAEDARLITIRKLREERLAAERAAAAQREAQAKAEAEQEAQRRAAAEADAKAQTQARAEAEAEQQRAERARLEAELAAERAARERAEAEHARQQAENEKTELRTRLRDQLNAVLETRDTARGLIVNVSDVLFDTGSATLRPGAREKLARVAGILQAQPGLRLEVEGHTDSVGSEEYNQRLSERRAEAVREYLVGQGLPPDSVAARGFGKDNPVASNATASGRQQNRRVEMVVSGDIIGQRTASPSQTPMPNTDNPSIQ